ncbi:MAG: hypothetical protein SPL05_07075 [Eubacteriales bacterium]|nr:hypothetical protein [Eubacteriales bacterium]
MTETLGQGITILIYAAVAFVLYKSIKSLVRVYKEYKNEKK